MWGDTCRSSGCFGGAALGIKLSLCAILYSVERVNYKNSILNSINKLQKIYKTIQILLGPNSLHMSEKYIYVWLLPLKKLGSTDLSATLRFSPKEGSDKVKWNVYPSSLFVFLFFFK